MVKTLAECSNFFRSNFDAIFKIFGLYVIVTSIVSPLIELLDLSSQNAGVNLLYLVVLYFINTYLMVRFIKFMASSVSSYSKEQKVSFNEWRRLLVIYLLYTIGVALGSIALILPGLYIAAKYAFADFEAILNDKPVFSAFSESWRDTDGIAGRLMAFSILIGGAQLLIGFFFTFIGEASTSLYLASEIADGLISTSLMIFMSIIYFRLYTEDRSISGEPIEGEV
ncbi:hypothetical protein KI743_10275 [Vibrio sp. D420a]|uniref:hypothetical protein n=1 Tax=Vibrio sp. D420a TaxID=2836895 RepID=UPI002554493E|nr:hypothetical protein [Vibrio sp. D420a]MDK9762390.1 hypothetical protein [Vibrio sp. D420a]